MAVGANFNTLLRDTEKLQNKASYIINFNLNNLFNKLEILKLKRFDNFQQLPICI